jgi:hypothetical protein
MDVRFWHLADMADASPYVRFQGQSGHGEHVAQCPLMTQTGHDGRRAGIRIARRGIRLQFVVRLLEYSGIAGVSWRTAEERPSNRP